MKRNIIIIPFICLVFMMCARPYGASAQSTQNDYGYPHGSPFPPGGEPSITHTVNAYWTTGGEIDRTEIVVKAPGDMPTQIEGISPRESDGKVMYMTPVYATIAPDCNYHFIFVRKDDTRDFPGCTIFRSNGMGTVEIRIYGFTGRDYTVQPTLTIRYYHGKTLMGATSITLHPVSEKVKNREKKK